MRLLPEKLGVSPEVTGLGTVNAPNARRFPAVDASKSPKYVMFAPLDQVPVAVGNVLTSELDFTAGAEPDAALQSADVVGIRA